ncbi:MAG: YlmC/YmxH family sporulation protein [Oscillospiraceae bacterium]|nr:YlmC/YmxH family sporulation protein [Oscillospiraceae bacterium]
MKCTLSEMRAKEVINVKTGARLGYVDDLEFDTSDASVNSFLVYGRSRFFGLLGRDEDLVIKCKDIQLVGEDTVLVSLDEVELAKRHTIYHKRAYGHL